MHISALNAEISSLKMEMERMKSLAESERKEIQGKNHILAEHNYYIIMSLQNSIFFHLFHIVCLMNIFN